jgi:MFS family permease
MARGWKFWRKVFTAACYSSIMSIQITSSIVAPIFAIAGPGFGLTTSEVAQVFSVYYLPNVVSSLAAGVLASLFGRRRVLFVGCTVLSAGCVALGLVPEFCSGAVDDSGGAAVSAGVTAAPDSACLYSLFISARVLQGMGVALSQTCLFAMLADL